MGILLEPLYFEKSKLTSKPKKLQILKHSSIGRLPVNSVPNALLTLPEEKRTLICKDIPLSINEKRAVYVEGIAFLSM